jgi:hypothetical protein
VKRKKTRRKRLKLNPQMLLNNALRALACVALAFSTQALLAQGAYRCDDNGKVTYQAAPCAGGKLLDQAAKPSADQKGIAEADAAQERADAKKMARERAARERSTPAPSGAAGIEGYKTTSMQEREGVVKNKTKRSKAHKKTKATKIMKPKEPKKAPNKPSTK